MPRMNSLSLPLKNILLTTAFLAISTLFPLMGWFSVAYFFHIIEIITGFNAPLVSEPGGVDLGAVLVTFIYAVLSLILIKKLIASGNKILAIVIGILSLCFLYYVFVLVSSLIWF